ncbi:MAG: glycosyltransferase, partial [Leptolyngbyaceae cyanobacterium]
GGGYLRRAVLGLGFCNSPIISNVSPPMIYEVFEPRLHFGFFEPGLLVGILTTPGIVALLISQHLRPWETPVRMVGAIAVLWIGVGGIAATWADPTVATAAAGIGMILSLIFCRWFKNYCVAAHIMMAATALTLFFGLGWGITFIQSLPISELTRSLIFWNLGLGLLALPLILVTLLPTQAYLLRKRWHRPRHSLDPLPRDTCPKVSFHVPCYAEPPEVVCATLNTLSEMHYPNFEVLVIDNNTKDPNLWQPVEQHCHSLGSRFRFFHVDPLPGAKAGALNFALAHTTKDAELIAVIDADYQAQPDFLERLVGFFDVPTIGFVQTPHDYRDWQHSFYLRACYWEYMLFFRLQLACLNEWVASFIIGTMCITRKEAIEKAGGWAEWCLTEDSEAAVRIHALGYRSIFLTETFGRGLIPENFQDYKKQRLRWTIGPIQQIQRHWQLYLPNPLAAPSQLTFWQRILETSHSLGGMQPAIALLNLPLGIATLVSIIHHQEVIPIPPIVWIAAAITLPAALAHTWLTYHLLGCHRWRDIAGAILASISLGYVRLVGAVLAWRWWQPLPWRRTNKFKSLPDRIKALDAVKLEIFIALVFMVAGGTVAPHATYVPPDLLCLVTVGLGLTSIAHLTAPLMTLLAEADLRWGHRQSP